MEARIGYIWKSALAARGLSVSYLGRSKGIESALSAR